MTALVFDTETTGHSAPEVIEAAWLELDNPQQLTVLNTYEARFKPERPISLGALATHHILDEELVDCPPSASFSLSAGVQYLIGHNVHYERQFRFRPHVKRIITLALSRNCHPGLDSHYTSA